MIVIHGRDTVWLENDRSGAVRRRHLIVADLQALSYRVLRADNDRYPDLVAISRYEVLLYRNPLRHGHDWVEETIDTMDFVSSGSGADADATPVRSRR